MAAWNNGKVVEHKQWNESLHTLYVESDIEPFQAGQFAKIGLEIDGESGPEIIGRPYSLCNAPESRPLEFYYIELPGGPLTSHLAKLKPGDTILVAPRANGFMILDEVPQARHLWLMATGTGVGPFLAILSSEKPWQRFERVVLVYAVRNLSELSYQERIMHLLARHAGQLEFIPFISREASDFALSGRIPQAIADGRLEQRAGIKFSAQDSQIMLCGNPAMVEDTTNMLTERGLKRHRRKDPGQITVENYW
jgi:ferredoxin/flavodoxin---NADP+ reductase